MSSWAHGHALVADALSVHNPIVAKGHWLYLRAYVLWTSSCAPRPTVHEDHSSGTVGANKSPTCIVVPCLTVRATSRWSAFLPAPKSETGQPRKEWSQRLKPVTVTPDLEMIGKVDLISWCLPVELISSGSDRHRQEHARETGKAVGRSHRFSDEAPKWQILERQHQLRPFHYNTPKFQD
nr:hypothetical protein CFP56_70015 [Quercus suber]